MSHTSLLFHCVFSTKGRKSFIKEAYQRRLWAYMGGIAKTNGFKAMEVGEPTTTFTCCFPFRQTCQSQRRCS